MAEGPSSIPKGATHWTSALNVTTFRRDGHMEKPSDGREVIMMLRPGKSLLNKKRNELVPKFAVDLFLEDQLLPGVAINQQDIGLFSWILDVQTTDRSGYVADDRGQSVYKYPGPPYW